MVGEGPENGTPVVRHRFSIRMPSRARMCGRDKGNLSVFKWWWRLTAFGRLGRRLWFSCPMPLYIPGFAFWSVLEGVWFCFGYLRFMAGVPMVAVQV